MLASLPIASGDGFAGWQALNDTIMGGRSQGAVQISSDGLLLQAFVEPEGGGFVSCRSPVFDPPLDLSAYGALELAVDGDGRRYKLAIACRDGMAGLTELIPGGLRWVHEFGTEHEGFSSVRIGFDQLTPSVRAQPIEKLPMGLPLRLDAARITRLQLLHSKFDDAGGLNPGFRPGPIDLELRAIHAVI
jgi:hypothetical protein